MSQHQPQTAAHREAATRRSENPSAHFGASGDVVTDASLSLEQKKTALDHLELDARLLQKATDEGMSGGEQNKLADVLDAKTKIGAKALFKPA
jgi:Fe-S cluster assembly ATPase SufC